MFKPSVTADSPGYRPNNAFEWPLTDNILWDQPLGEKLCIIDLDNRPFTEPHQLFGQQIMSWDHGKDVHGLSLGVLNHWIYGTIVASLKHVSGLTLVPNFFFSFLS